MCVRLFFSLRLCWLLLGIRLAVTTAQSLNGLQSRILFSSFCLFACFYYFRTCENCLFACVHNVGMYGGVCVKLTGPQSRLAGKTTPPFNILNVTVPVVTSFQPPPFLFPACLFWRVAFACLKLSHSPGALSSVGDLAIGYHFQRIESNPTLQIPVTIGKNASANINGLQ